MYILSWTRLYYILTVYIISWEHSETARRHPTVLPRYFSWAPQHNSLSLMSTSPHGGDSNFPKPEPRLTGVKAALRYTGIPPSWLDKRPSLPSRNWLIFLGVTSTITGWYIYDRRQCKSIRQEYADKVKHLSEVPLHSLDYPRKVTVYGSKWPGDEDSDRSLRYFRKYVKVRANALFSSYSLKLMFLWCSLSWSPLRLTLR